MNVLTQKLRHIYAPFLVVAAGFVVGYSLLAWGLIYRTGLISLDGDLVTWWLPLGLAWIPARLWISPRIKVLELETKKGDLPFLYLFVAVATMVWPTVQAQMYLSKMTASITRLGDIEEIKRSPATRYYTVDRPCLRREGTQFDSASELGRRRDNLKFTISVVVPFCDGTGTSPGGAPPAWMALTFSKWTRNSGTDKQKEWSARSFARESEDAFKRMDFGGFAYLEVVGPGARRRGFDAAIHKADPAMRAPILLQPHMGDFEGRAGTEGDWALGAFAGMAALWLVMLLFPGVHNDRLHHLRNGTRPDEDGGSAWRAFLIPGRDTFGTLSLAYLNVLVFLAMVLSGLGVVGFRVDDLVGWGALSRVLLHGPGLLRLLACQFVHGGLAHVMGNLYGLLFAGLMLEAVIGGRRLLLTYLVAGTVGGIASVLVHPATVTVGASGAIFGLFGVLFGLLLVKDERVMPARNFLLVNAGIYVGLNLFLGAVSPGVDNAAHLGGLLAGVLMGPFLRKGSTGKGRPALRPSRRDRHLAGDVHEGPERRRPLGPARQVEEEPRHDRGVRLEDQS